MRIAVEEPIVRAFRRDDEASVLTLLQTTLAGGPTGSRSVEFLRWKHMENPFGRSIGLIAEASGAIVGVRLVMRWAFVAAEGRIAAGRMVDTATHPAWQGRGIFRALTTASLEIARHDTALIFNTPNVTSRPGYLSMGWTEVGKVPTSISVAHPIRLLRGARWAFRHEGPKRAPAPRGLDLPPVADVLDDHADDVSALLEARRLAARGRLTTATDLTYLRWRYCDPPGLDYRAVPVVHAGRLTGLGIGRLRRRGTLREFTLAEVLVDPNYPEASRTVLRRARRSGVDYVATHLPLGSPAARGLRAAGYATSRRVGLTLTELPLSDLVVDPAFPANWSLSLGDLEVF